VSQTSKTHSPAELKRWLKVAEQVSVKAGKNSLKYFNKKIAIDSKDDNSPVTRADREAELIIRDTLGKRFKNHKIIGEEFGTSGPKSDYKWWIDPIDGTLQFIRGLPFWGSVLGLEYKNEVILGALHFPAIGLSLSAAKGHGCFANKKRAKVSQIKSPSKSLILHSGLRMLRPAEMKRLRLFTRRCRDDRGIGDAYGHSLVIRGIADALVDFRVNPYDVSAVKICVEEAGGKFTALSGENSIHERSILCSNGLLHEKVRKALSA